MEELQRLRVRLVLLQDSLLTPIQHSLQHTKASPPRAGSRTACSMHTMGNATTQWRNKGMWNGAEMRGGKRTCITAVDIESTAISFDRFSWTLLQQTLMSCQCNHSHLRGEGQLVRLSQRAADSVRSVGMQHATRACSTDATLSGTCERSRTLMAGRMNMDHGRIMSDSPRSGQQVQNDKRPDLVPRK